MGPAAVGLLILEDSGENVLVVITPFFTTMVDEGLAGIIMLVEVVLSCREVEVCVLSEVVNAFAGSFVLNSFMLLEAEAAGAGKGEVVIGASHWSFIEPIAKTSALVLAVFEEG